MGKNKDTIKIEKNGVAYMFFRCDDTDKFKQYKEMKINLVGKANLNEWGGRTTPQIFVEDYEIFDDTLGF